MSDWEEVKRLFHEALRDRRVLEGAPGAVRAEVESLLKAHEAAPPEPAREGPGSVIGRYKLLQQIGEGGFGVVYMAEQTEPVRRKVALKVLKPGMDTGQVVARFEAERQALALMDHENIARVLDAGTTASGRPYFVMELVKGVPITQYCDEAHVDTRGRLLLFLRVCAAVQHAHQKGIIHRDLKPSNVLVTLHDGEPVPKVIDFGIAKAIDQRLTEKTLFTEFRQMIGTPEYMAPEQAELSGLDVDTRADVYSLGVLLYELLTGTKPFELGRKGYEEIVRTIREAEPQRPSTRVSTMGEALLAVAQKRQTPPAILGRLLRGDLDWIVLKALEKERSRRYATADGLALDVRRYLADEPVHAMPASAAYRLRKFVRRHRIGVAAAGVVVLAVLVSVGGALAGMREARTEAAEARRAAGASTARRDEATAARAREAEERARAETGALEAAKEAARADAILGFVDRMLSPADPHQVKGRGYTLRQLLDDFDRGLGEGLRGEPEVEAFLRNTMGRAYVGLGLPDRASPHLRIALDLRTKARGADSPEARESLGPPRRLDRARKYMMRHRVGAAAASLAVATLLAGAALAFRGYLDAAGQRSRAHASREEAAREAEAAEAARAHEREQRALADAREAEARTRAEQSNAVLHLVGGMLASANPHEARDPDYTVREILEDFDRDPGARRGDAPQVEAALRVTMGKAYLGLGLPERAAPHIETALGIRRRGGEECAAFADALAARARLEHDLGRFREAAATAREVVAIRRRLGGDDEALAEALDCLADDLRHVGELDEAERVGREALALRRATPGGDLARSLDNLAGILRERGELDGAERLLEEALALRRAKGGLEFAACLSHLADVRCARGDFEGAERLEREALAILAGVEDGAHPAPEGR